MGPGPARLTIPATSPVRVDLVDRFGEAGAVGTLDLVHDQRRDVHAATSRTQWLVEDLHGAKQMAGEQRQLRSPSERGLAGW
jgi:hypothetical protein